MITEDYVSFETAKLLKEKGFDEDTITRYDSNGEMSSDERYGLYNSLKKLGFIPAPTLQMAMKWLREVHKVLVIIDYEYECTDTSYYYKLYKLDKNGKPDRVPVKGVSYENDSPIEHIVAFRDYRRSFCDYGTYEEACEAAIKYCLENWI